MKTTLHLLLLCLSFLFASGSILAVNNVASVKNNTNNSSQLEQKNLETKKDNTSLKKIKALNLYKKIKKIADDTELILLVILAILLPPLAVYLKDKNISTLFWITLILCLLSGGWFFGPYFFGGFWFIAMLLAILRVFDII